MQPYKKSTITTVIFDLGGVLVDWDPRHLYRKVFTGDEVAMERFLTEIRFMDWNLEQDKGHPFVKAVEEKVAEFPHYEEQIRAYHTRWEEMIPDQFPESIELLRALHQNGTGLHVLSNFSAETFPIIRSRYDFFDYFNSIMLSADVGLAKPDQAIYKLLLSRIDRQPQECLFIDDSEPNVLAAHELGIDAIHFISPEDLKRELLVRGMIN